MEENKVLTDEQNKKIDAEIKEILPLIKDTLNFLEGDECVIGKALLLLLLSTSVDVCNKRIKNIVEKENKQ